MITRIHWINETEIGENRIGTMARPRGNDWLEDEIKSLKLRKVDYLISLLEDYEMWELGLEEEKELCKKWKVQFINFPIEDVSTPKNEVKFIQLIDELAAQMKEGKSIVIHCRMGIGRASLFAAALMIKLGYQAKGIFEIISTYRKLKVPDTEEQKKWILDIERKLKPN